MKDDQVSEQSGSSSNGNVVPFIFKDYPVRVVRDAQGKPWFLAKDVATVLGYADTDRDHQE